MKVYNQSKTEILKEYDLSKGYLVDDTIINNIPEQKGETAKEKAEKYIAIGIKVEHINGKYYLIKEIYKNGASLEEIKETPPTPAYVDIENIKVFIPYTENELKEIKLNALRQQRKILLDAFDKWEKAVLRGREIDDSTIMVWFNDLLNLDENAFNNIPEVIKYYLGWKNE